MALIECRIAGRRKCGMDFPAALPCLPAILFARLDTLLCPLRPGKAEAIEANTSGESAVSQKIQVRRHRLSLPLAIQNGRFIHLLELPVQRVKIQRVLVMEVYQF